MKRHLLTAIITVLLLVFVSAGSSADTPTRTKRVFLLVFDPVVPVAGSPKLHQHRGWSDPYELAAQYQAWITSTTDTSYEYVIASVQEVDGIPVKADGYQYTIQTYLDCIDGVPGACHRPDQVDYEAVVADHGLCGALNDGTIDEVWMFGAPYFGFWESTLAGPGAFFYNSSPVQNTSCQRLLPIMGYSYERQLAEMVHNLGHRFESTMAYVYGSWGANLDHNWNRFALVTPSFPYSGCGNTHFPPNGISDYDYGNGTPSQTFCHDFVNYPDLVDDPSAIVASIDCSAWGCSQLGYLTWWFGQVPRKAGVGPDGHLMDWWAYLIDPNVVIDIIFADGFEFGNLTEWD